MVLRAWHWKFFIMQSCLSWHRASGFKVSSKRPTALSSTCPGAVHVTTYSYALGLTWSRYKQGLNLQLSVKNKCSNHWAWFLLHSDVTIPYQQIIYMYIRVSGNSCCNSSQQLKNNGDQTTVFIGETVHVLTV